MKRNLIVVSVLSLFLTALAGEKLSYTNIVTSRQTLDTLPVPVVVDLQDPYINIPDENGNIYPYIEILANRFNIDTMDLFILIHFETAGTMDPAAANPKSSSKGMIQFTNESARKLVDKNGKKLKSSRALVTAYPTAKEQLEIPNRYNKYGGPVYQYLKLLEPFKSTEDLYMAIMYPPARGAKGNLPKFISQGNLGIKNAKEYVALARKRAAQRGIDKIDID